MDNSTLGILVVDDEETVLCFAARCLEMQGYRVLKAHNAEQALALLRDDLSQVSLLITDINMPGISGIQLADAFVSLHPSAAVLFMSGGQVPAGLPSLGLTVRYLSKPFEASTLRQCVTAILQNASSSDHGPRGAYGAHLGFIV